MEPARSISRLGFRRWYERQLIESHVWLVTALLCGIAMAALLEVVDFKNAGDTLVTLAFVFVGGLICWKGFERFRTLMVRAEAVASHSTCDACAAYAKFSVVDENARFRVRCRKCGNEWVIHGQAEDGAAGEAL
jgi:hypothetical protein